eukprot:gnl/TRDRNA2_/TRDRNA2_195821_c0_seq1.p1 gnl/TRDRNA2_/TRDRNA2_195821_c0~~gnl/TRDRNA2_/TRDRNA2_195821_c0_seq1.p1  ORF type:complete len:191 (-),score=28.43 gnl/TRDRNA2_/TRDRNA2_195821_c0_seq1:37-609(-)
MHADRKREELDARRRRQANFDLLFASRTGSISVAALQTYIAEAEVAGVFAGTIEEAKETLRDHLRENDLCPVHELATQESVASSRERLTDGTSQESSASSRGQPTTGTSQESVQCCEATANLHPAASSGSSSTSWHRVVDAAGPEAAESEVSSLDMSALRQPLVETDESSRRGNCCKTVLAGCRRSCGVM